MSQYDSDNEQLEAFKRWWKDNGSALVVGLTIGLAVLFGYRYWTEAKAEKAEQASVTYNLMMESLRQGNYEVAADLGNGIIANFEESAYSVLAALLLGKLEVDRQNLTEAKARLAWARDHATSSALKQVASSRIAQVMLFEGDAAGAWGELAGSGAADAEDFYELKGDIRAAMGNYQSADDFYGQAITALTEQGFDTRFIELKRDNLPLADAGSATTP
ncbi:MAG: tetratricopeptide repeat protein [Gammaproteobacteria bacterium]|nr:tetratricopeptide repeat protein [Gammaproteobacteria bacterium]